MQSKSELTVIEKKDEVENSNLADGAHMFYLAADSNEVEDESENVFELL